MIDKILNHIKNDVKHRIWIFSDLQQSNPVNAKNCMVTAVKDFKSLNMNCDQIWYLGDAIEGHDIKLLNEMIDMQINILNQFHIPIKYVLGNHDFDYYRHHHENLNQMICPFYDSIKDDKNWTSIRQINDFYFIEDFSDFRILFLSDHACPNGDWFTSHGAVHGQKEDYPHHKEIYKLLNEAIKNSNKNIITVSHYSFAGGNRDDNSQLLNLLLPLPKNMKLHIYGHAHIGDTVWAGKNSHRKISWIDHHNIPQINVSSLENTRGSAIRSTILEIYQDNSIGLYMRNHTEKKWEENLILENNF